MAHNGRAMDCPCRDQPSSRNRAIITIKLRHAQNSKGPPPPDRARLPVTTPVGPFQKGSSAACRRPRMVGGALMLIYEQMFSRLVVPKGAAQNFQKATNRKGEPHLSEAKRSRSGGSGGGCRRPLWERAVWLSGAQWPRNRTGAAPHPPFAPRPKSAVRDQWRQPAPGTPIARWDRAESSAVIGH